VLTRVGVRVHPRASRERLLWNGEVLSIWITQPPVEGAANAAVVRIVAGWLNVPPSRVRLVGGLRSRRKLVEVDVAPTRLTLARSCSKSVSGGTLAPNRRGLHGPRGRADLIRSVGASRSLPAGPRFGGDGDA